MTRWRPEGPQVPDLDPSAPASTHQLPPAPVTTEHPRPILYDHQGKPLVRERRIGFQKR